MSIQEAIMQLRECQQERDSMLEGKRIADALMAEGSQRIEELRQERDSLAAQLAEAKRQNAEQAVAMAAKDRSLTDILDLLSFGQGSSRKENKAREALALKPADALVPVREALKEALTSLETIRCERLAARGLNAEATAISAARVALDNALRSIGEEPSK